MTIKGKGQLLSEIAMTQNTISLFDALALVPDHRSKQGNRHPLQAVLAMTVAAVMAGHTSLAAISQWGREVYRQHRDWMRRLGFRSFTSPSVSTLHEIFTPIDITIVEAILAEWIAGLVGNTSWRAVSIDGKTLRGSAKKKTEAPGVHLLSAYLHHPGCVLAQLRVDGKTNEHKAALELIGQLILEKTVIVGDAMFCQKDLCDKIVDSGGDYFVTVKDNQETLKNDIAEAFREPFSPLGTPRVAG